MKETKVEGLERTLEVFRKLSNKSKKEWSAKGVVGYKQDYAIYVHENLEARHPVGQAKFLEQPARQYSKDIAAVIAQGLRRKLTLAKALMLGCLFLQRKSQELCPVDTGALRASAYSEVAE